VILILVAAVAIGTRGLSERVRAEIIKSLEKDFESRLEIKTLDVSLFPSVNVTGTGLVLHHKGRTDIPPLIVIDRFTAQTSLLSLIRIPAHVSEVRLEGLQVHVQAEAEKGAADGTKPPKAPSNFVIDRVIADGARVETIPSKPGKEPLVWRISKLTLSGAGPDRAMSFRATLTNARPPGGIETTGSFGPWQADEPSETPVSGKYTFRNANLGVFHGISGTLASVGDYTGVLQQIEVKGNTDTPDFALTIAGNRVSLKTEFHAIVDGTNGTTKLDPVIAHFGRTTVTARGIVDTTPGQPGKIISLDSRVQHGRLEDMLRLAVKGPPPMTGAIAYHAKFVLPLMNEDVSKALRLDGAFDVEAAQFTKPDAQQKVDKLSNRGRGQTDDAADDVVASNFRGKFALRDGVMHFTDLAFTVPGVAVQLSGDYTLDDGRMDLHGMARLQAKLSQTTTGFKSFLLKAVDPFFSKKGKGAVLPIHISGTRDSPSFGLDLGHKAK